MELSASTDMILLSGASPSMSSRERSSSWWDFHAASLVCFQRFHVYKSSTNVLVFAAAQCLIVRPARLQPLHTQQMVTAAFMKHHFKKKFSGFQTYPIWIYSHREQGGMQILAVNMFSLSTDVTTTEVFNSIQMSLNNCSSSLTHCRMFLQHRLSYHSKSVRLKHIWHTFFIYFSTFCAATRGHTSLSLVFEQSCC